MATVHPAMALETEAHHPNWSSAHRTSTPRSDRTESGTIPIRVRVGVNGRTTAATSSRLFACSPSTGASASWSAASSSRLVFASPAMSLALNDMRSPERASASGGGGDREFNFAQLQLQPLPPSTATRRATPPLSASSAVYPHAYFSQSHEVALAEPFASPRLAQQQQQYEQPPMSSQSSSVFQNGDSLSRSMSPVRAQLSQQFGAVGQQQQQQQQALDSSFRSASSQSQSQSQLQPMQPARNAAVQSEMLMKAREGLHKLQAEVEVERQRRQAAERSGTANTRERASRKPMHEIESRLTLVCMHACCDSAILRK